MDQITPLNARKKNPARPYQARGANEPHLPLQKLDAIRQQTRPPLPSATASARHNGARATAAVATFSQRAVPPPVTVQAFSDIWVILDDDS
jgi:hypothetical protein